MKLNIRALSIGLLLLIFMVSFYLLHDFFRIQEVEIPGFEEEQKAIMERFPDDRPLTEREFHERQELLDQLHEKKVKQIRETRN